jgi:hypothetical protein
MNRQHNKLQHEAVEEKLIKNIKDNMNKHKTNKDLFEEDPNCFTRCPRYNPCPICNKCENKASHLYIKCERCEIPMCTHKYKDRENMIHREKNTIEVTSETIDKIKEIADRKSR